MAMSVYPADDGQALDTIYQRGHVGTLPDYWALVDGEFRPAQWSG